MKQCMIIEDDIGNGIVYCIRAVKGPVFSYSIFKRRYTRGEGVAGLSPSCSIRDGLQTQEAASTSMKKSVSVKKKQGYKPVELHPSDVSSEIAIALCLELFPDSDKNRGDSELCEGEDVVVRFKLDASEGMSMGFEYDAKVLSDDILRVRRDDGRTILVDRDRLEIVGATEMWSLSTHEQREIMKAMNGGECD